MKIYEIAQKKSTTFDITGGSAGNAVMTIDGVDYIEAWASSDDATAAAFVATHDADILAAHDVTVTNPSTSLLLFVSTTTGRVFTISAAPTGDVTISAGVQTKDGLAAQLFTDNHQDGGNMTIMEIKNFADFGGAFESHSREDNLANIGEGNLEILRRNVQHEVDLVAYATDNDCTLTRKETDGSGGSALVTE